ncbi:MAG: hypothetical protein WAK97_04100, partial [Pseudolabrys sp.]
SESIDGARQANQATTSIDGIKATRIPSTKSGVIDLLHCHYGTFELPTSFVSNHGRTLSQIWLGTSSPVPRNKFTTQAVEKDCGR